MSGAGKSKSYVRPLISTLQRKRKTRRLVIINRKQEFSDLVPEKARFMVDESIHPDRLHKMFRTHQGGLFFQITGYDPRPFLDTLGTEIMKWRDVTLLIEEASEFVPRGKAPKAIFRTLTAGREQNINVIAVTQMLQSQMAGVDLAFIQQCSKLVLFRLQGENDLERANALFPELGEGVSRLKSHDGLPPEYAVKDMLTHECGVYRRDPVRPTTLVWHDLTQRSHMEVKTWTQQQLNS
jgi:hypothetical protein